MLNSQLNKIDLIDSLDDKFKGDWGFKAINAHKAWKTTKGEGVKIAVIDTGIDMSHPDLLHSFKQGINMFEKSKNVTDELGHGTHVAGLIAGKRTGVAPNSDLYIAKVLDKNGNGTMASVLDGITFAINNNVDVLCMSLGIKGGLPVILQERIMNAYSKGINIVCATGNDNHYEPDYPAFMNEVIAVGGVDKNLKRATFSNTGKQIDVVAPAIDILSTYKDNNYARMSGTSMASPLVAGAIALIISYNRKKGIELEPKDIRNMISNLGEHSYEYGYGLMDLNKLMD